MVNSPFNRVMEESEVVLKIQTEEKFLGSDIILTVKSFQSLLDARCGTNGRNPEDVSSRF